MNANDSQPPDDKAVPDHNDGKRPGTTSGNEDYGSTEREPDDGHARHDEQRPKL